MKNLRKIIGLFIFIFITGIIITVISINTALNTKETKEFVKTKNTLYLLKKTRKRV